MCAVCESVRNRKEIKRSRDQEIKRSRDQEREKKQTCHLRAKITKIGGGFDELAGVRQFFCKVGEGLFIIKKLLQPLNAFRKSDQRKERQTKRKGDQERKLIVPHVVKFRESEGNGREMRCGVDRVRLRRGVDRSAVR